LSSTEPAPSTEPRSLPENAYRELEPGETYTPAVPPDQPCREVTRRSVVIGLVMSVFFSAAVSYLTLKLGQGLEAAIPIAILAIGLGVVFRRRSTLLENVNIISIGATSGIVVGGSLFVMPAIFILKLDRLSGFFQIFIVPLLGAVLGVLLLIPFRRYFVRQMHGKLPFPEGTAITEVLVTGEKGGKQARVLAKAMGIGAAFDGLVLMFGAWRENFTTELVGGLSTLAHKYKVVFSLNTTAAIAGLGYLIGLRYASFIMAGSMLSYFVVVPLFAFVGQYIPEPIGLGLPPIAQMSADEIFINYARYIGIGGICMAGFISILKMLPVIGQAFGSGLRQLLRGRGRPARDPAEGSGGGELPRDQQDIPMGWVAVMILVVMLLIWVYFRFVVLAGMERAWTISILATLIAGVIAFLFSAVSAWAVAMISVTPISGMTLMTLIISAVALSALGLRGEAGMLAILLIGGVVCTALSMSGTLVTEFKIAYWLGATPRRVQWSNIFGCVAAALVVTGTMLLLGETYGFYVSAAHPHPLPAPQANAMAAVIKAIVGTPDPTKWYLYAFGAAIAVIIELLGISSLAFALGMYIPIEYNSPILVGAIVAHLVRRSTSRDALGRARYDRGILLASGLIAGGALMGVLSAVVSMLCNSLGWQLPSFGQQATVLGNATGLVLFIGLCGYLYWDACRAREEDAGPSLEV
jgi:putative OPT family oligopeptide transporter